MRVSQLKLGFALLVLAAAPFLFGCTPKVSGMDCAAILEHAKEISQGQPVKIQAVANPHETSRTPPTRARGQCHPQDDSNGTIYIRAYEGGMATPWSPMRARPSADPVALGR